MEISKRQYEKDCREMFKLGRNYQKFKDNEVYDSILKIEKPKDVCSEDDNFFYIPITIKKEKVAKKKEKCLFCYLIKPFQFLKRLTGPKS